MRVPIVVLAYGVVSVLVSTASAQATPDGPAEASRQPTSVSPWNPTAVPAFGFQDAAIAKIYRDTTGSQVLGLITFQEVTVTYQVTKTRTEQRTRNVEDPDTGETLDQTYTVQVPYSEEVQSLRLQKQRIEVPLQHAQFWTTSGEAVSAEQAQSVLSEPTRCFLVDRVWKANIDPLFTQLLNKNVLFIWHDSSKAKRIALPSATPN